MSETREVVSRDERPGGGSGVRAGLRHDKAVQESEEERKWDGERKAVGDEYVFIAGSTVGPADEKLALTLCWRWRGGESGHGAAKPHARTNLSPRRESREPMITRFLGTNVPFLGAHPVEVINESCTEREIRLKYVSLMLYSIAISHEQTTKLSLR